MSSNLIQRKNLGVSDEKHISELSSSVSVPAEPQAAPSAEPRSIWSDSEDDEGDDWDSWEERRAFETSRMNELHDLQIQLLTLYHEIRADQQSISRLLQSHTQPSYDVSQIAQKLWDSNNDGWTGLPKGTAVPGGKSVGFDFLNSLAPCGTSFEASKKVLFDSGAGCIWSQRKNLSKAHEIFEDGLMRHGKYSFKRRGSSPINCSVEQAQNHWPKEWHSGGSAENRSSCQFVYPMSSKGSLHLAESSSIEKDLAARSHSAASGENPLCGMIHRICLDHSLGIIDFKNIAAVLCLSQGTEFLNTHIAEGWDMHVLRKCTWGIFTTPSAKTTMRGLSTSRNIYYGIYMHFMRSFVVAESADTGASGKPSPTGLKIARKRMNFHGPDNEGPLTLTERRYSTALSLLPLHRPFGHFALAVLIDGRPGDQHEAIGTNNGPISDDYKSFEKYGLYPAGLHCGVSVLQLQICTFIESWEQDWIKTIAAMDSKISLSSNFIDDNEHFKRLMMDPDADAPASYSNMFKTLALFADMIREAQDSLDMLANGARDMVSWDILLPKSYPHTEATKQVLKYNWDIVRKRQREASSRILDRLQRTTNEVQNLMDGLFNVRPVQQAQKGRSLNKSLLIFTAIAFLSSFMISCFRMSLLISSASEAGRALATLFVALGGITYTIAAMKLISAYEPAEKWRAWSKKLVASVKKQEEVEYLEEDTASTTASISDWISSQSSDTDGSSWHGESYWETREAL